MVSRKKSILPFFDHVGPESLRCFNCVFFQWVTMCFTETSSNYSYRVEGETNFTALRRHENSVQKFGSSLKKK